MLITVQGADSFILAMVRILEGFWLDFPRIKRQETLIIKQPRGVTYYI